MSTSPLISPASLPLGVPFPEKGQLLGIDYGTVRIGLALSTPNHSIASPLEIYQRSTLANDQKKFQKVVSEHRLAGIVVGWPIHAGGQKSQKSYESEQFGKWLHEVTGLPVCWHDERYTSTLAADALSAAGISTRKHKPLLDKLAAQLMLQSYLEAQARRLAPPVVEEDEQSG